MTILFAIDTSDLGTSRLRLVLITTLGRVTELIAVVALLHQAMNCKASILESLSILLQRLWICWSLGSTKSTKAEAEDDLKGLVEVALSIHDSVTLLWFHLHGDEIGLVLLLKKCNTEIDDGHARSSLEVSKACFLECESITFT
jgi:hypothetical protein